MKTTIAFATIVALSLTAFAPAYAQSRRREHHKEPERDCKASITVSGGSRPGTSLARGSARSVWQNEAKTKYGEQYQEIGFARDINYRCTLSSLGLRRCEISGIPCRVPEEPAKK